MKSSGSQADGIEDDDAIDESVFSASLNNEDSETEFLEII